MGDYQAFLEGKAFVAPPTGIEPPEELHEALFPFQADIVRWALRRGRAAIFADCGLGKTLMQLVWASHIPGKVLVLAPLAVTQQTVAEGERFGIFVDASRDGKPAGQITVTNYEQLHKFNPDDYEGVVLDESSIIKNYSGKMRNQILSSFQETPYRLACTATPAPNDHMELGNHAEFIGVMSRVEMLAHFFCHDGGDTSKWRLKGHAIEVFWEWVATWAVMIQQPSDLGYEDVGFILPPLGINEHKIDSDGEPLEGALFALPAMNLNEQRRARRETLEERVAFVAGLVNRTPGPWLVWCELNAEGTALAAAIDGAVEVSGTMTNDVKEERLLGFANDEFRVLVTKPKIGGFGMNWQHCHQMAFVGLSHSFEQFYQATRRCWRFGQRHPVQCFVVTTTRESAVLSNVQRKQRDYQTMAEEMVKHMADVSSDQLKGTTKGTDPYVEDTAEGEDWTIHLGDCVEVVSSMDDNSIDFSVFSPPFASLYTYSNSDRDMGNCTGEDAFADHLSFLVGELLRVTKPGRLLSFHCMNLPITKQREGFIGLSDFRGSLIRMMRDAGWIFHSEVCIWKDPVIAMQRTKAIGLLWKQIKKDSTMSRQGIPDYLVTMRAPGDNPEPVSHTPTEYPVDLWQQMASPVWMDINPSDTLQRESAREEKDERHIAPLQLEVIRRALHLWSNPGDLVLSPFAGIGSEGYVALREGRRFVGVELKRSYWEQARRNLASAKAQMSLAL